MEDRAVQGIAALFSEPAQLTSWVKAAIAELQRSISDDVTGGRYFAYLTRWRQPEELYYRTLYVLFVAEDLELPHIFSGEMPNGFRAMWKKVNDVVFEGRGVFEENQRGLQGEPFTIMDTINSAGHASLASMVMCIGLIRNREYRRYIPHHLNRWKRMCYDLNYMEEMFKAGKSKRDVLVAIQKIYKSRQTPTGDEHSNGAQ